MWTNSPTSKIGNWRIALTSANYDLAIELFKKQYGKKIAIQRALVNKLLNAHPAFTECDMSRLRSLYDFAEMKYRALQTLVVKVCHLDAFGRDSDSIQLTVTQILQ